MRVTDEDLFAPERRILESAQADLSNRRYNGNKLMPRYKSLVNQYQRLLTITRKVFHISDSQGKMLQRHQSDIQTLLDNANQGFLTFASDLKIDRQYSAACIKVFGKKIAGLSIVQLLGQGNDGLQERLRKILGHVFLSPNSDSDGALQQLPPVMQIGEKTVSVECKLITQSDTAPEQTLVMMILTDITERLQAEAQIRFLSYHDKLTALHNRAHIEAMLPELEKPEALPLSVIMADMNGLKLANDVFGHQQGDKLLVALANALKISCRPTDIIARWGGDEFVIVLPQTDQEECLQVCGQIRNACAARTDCAIPLSVAIGAETQTAGSARIMEMLSVAEHRMYNDKLTKNKSVRKSIVTNLEGMLLNRCFESEGHPARVRQLVDEFVAFLGIDLPAAERKLLNQLAQLHDIGKVAIPAGILGSPRTLTASEWDIIKSHSEVGYRMAQSIDEPVLADIILALHERWDGLGYPCGLKEDQIPFLARIFTIADTYDTITHDRPYRPARDKQTALKEIEAGMGTQFDPKLAKSFVEFINQKEAAN